MPTLRVSFVGAMAGGQKCPHDVADIGVFSGVFVRCVIAAKGALLHNAASFGLPLRALQSLCNRVCSGCMWVPVGLL